jgi:molybdopterin molybdotransferase
MNKDETTPAPGQGWLQVQDAQARILAQTIPAGVDRVVLDASLGLALGQPLDSPFDLPAFDNSAMDGYAFRWQDASAGARLPIAFEAAAGSDPPELPPGTAARIFTGGRVPVGADTVIMREDTEVDGEIVRLVALPLAGQGAHIRLQGTYVAKGQRLLEAGVRLGSAELSLLATCNKATIPVRPRPRVAVLSTGDELVPLGAALGPGQIVNSNAHMLTALIREAGGVPIPLPIVRDDMDATREAFEDAIGVADLVVSMGGVSVGDRDLVKPVMDELCDELDFWKVQLKPGKPLAFGVAREGTPLIGLPGNPVSSWVGFWQFVRPAIRKLLGCTSLYLPRRTLVLDRDMRSTPKRLDLVRGRLVQSVGSSQTRFCPLADQSSGNPMSIVGADALGLIPIGVSQMAAGDEIVVELLPQA